MANKPRPADNVFNLFGDDGDVAEEVSVGYRLLPPTPPAPPPGQVLDLAGKPKIVLAFGNGGSGKTSLMRWVAERAQTNGSKAKLAAIDPENRSLLNYFPAGGVYEPPSRDADKVAAWLKAFFDALIREQVSGLVDTGGGDTAFGKIITEMPDLVAGLESEGIATVAVYMFAPRIADISPLATLSGAGFQPAATALVLNEGQIKPGDGDADQAFRDIRRHSVYRAALDRGAVELRMPLLSVAKKLEARSLQYRDARDGIVPEGRKVVPLGWSDRASLRSWLTRMDDAMAPISSWWP